METVEINQQILDQMDRQLTFIIFFAGTIVTLAILVIGYQLTINKKIVSEIKKENKEIITEIVAPLFINNINQMARLGGYGLGDIEEAVQTYKDNFPSNDAVNERMLFLKFRYQVHLMNEAIRLAPMEKVAELEEIRSRENDIFDFFNSVHDIIKDSEQFNKEKKDKQIYYLDKLRAEMRELEIMFKRI